LATEIDAGLFKQINSQSCVLEKFAYRIVRSREEAEDIVQETLMQAFKSLSSGLRPENLRGWIFTIAYNKAIDYIREAEKQKLLEDRIVVKIHENIHRGEKVNVFDEVLDKIPVTYRAAFILRFIHGFKFEDISVVMDTPVGTCKVYAGRALNSLRIILKERGL